MTLHGLAAPAPARTETAKTTARTTEATEFRLLGPVAVYDRQTGTGITPSGPKQRALLATLVVHAGEQLSVDRLVEELWGDRPPPTRRAPCTPTSPGCAGCCPPRATSGSAPCPPDTC